MYRSPLLFVAAFYGLLNTGLAAPAEAEECLVGSYVVFEVQPYQVVCGGVTSTSQVTKYVPFPQAAKHSIIELTQVLGRTRFHSTRKQLVLGLLMSQNHLASRMLQVLRLPHPLSL